MIAVITCKRLGADYLASTIKQIDGSAHGRRIAIADRLDWRPNSPIPPLWESHAFARPATERNENRWALWEAIRLAAEAREDLVFFEDDVQLCSGAARYMEQFQVPLAIDWVSFFDPWLDDQAPHGLWSRPARQYIYCQAMKLPFRTVERFAAISLSEMAACQRIGADDQLAWWGTAPWKAGRPDPSGLTATVPTSTRACTSKWPLRKRS